MKRLLPITLLPLAGIASAHDGHGLATLSHWHATDAIGWVAAAVAVAVGLWWARRS